MNRMRDRLNLLPLRQAEAYWLALLTAGRLPKRSQIDPRGLGHILKFVFILERSNFQQAKFRLAGSHLTKLAGEEVQGMPITSFFELVSRDEVASIVDEVLITPAVVELDLISSGLGKNTNLGAQMLLLPIDGQENQDRLILGVLASKGPIGEAPYRFSIETKIVRKIAGISGRFTNDAQTTKEFSEGPSVFEHHPKRHLRLVASRDD